MVEQTKQGVVVEHGGGINFKVDVAGEIGRYYLSGKMRMHKIKVLIGDRVEVVLPPGSAIGRIIRRN